MTQARGWKIGTIRGVRLYLHGSLLFLLFYVVLIAGMQFQFVARESGVDLAAVRGTPFEWGLLLAISLFVSIFCHEFGHVLVAQAMGTQVTSITLLMLGGISQMERLPDRKYAEFKVAIAGPLVSFAIAAGLYALQHATRSANVGLFAFWLGRANLVLGIFNLLPAFPTDGGRVLRSLLAARQGKLRGTQNAVKVSQVFAWIFGIVGILQFNILLVVIAVFVYMGAKSELFAALGHTVLRGLRAGDVGRRLEPISQDLNLEQAAAAMAAEKSLVLPVLAASGRPALVTAEQLKRIPRQRWAGFRVEEVMLEMSNGADVDEPLDEVLDHGLLADAGGVPLLERGRVVGVLRGSDVNHAIELRSLEPGRTDERPAA